MISWTAMLALVPASASAAKKIRTLKVVEPSDAYPWVPYKPDAPVMDAHDFTRWCLTIGETEGMGRVALHQLATEYCCQEMAGRVQPPRIDRMFTHIKPAGWQSYRPPTRVKDGHQHRPNMYRINPYSQAKS